MNLLFAINGGYIPTFLNCMRSVLLHGGASHYEVFILHSDLTDGDEADIRAALPDVGLHFVFVDALPAPDLLPHRGAPAAAGHARAHPLPRRGHDHH